MSSADGSRFPRQFVHDYFTLQATSRILGTTIFVRPGEWLTTSETYRMFHTCPCDLGNGKIAVLFDSPEMDTVTPSGAMLYARNPHGSFSAYSLIVGQKWWETIIKISQLAQEPVPHLKPEAYTLSHGSIHGEMVDFQEILLEALDHDMPAEARTTMEGIKNASLNGAQLQATKFELPADFEGFFRTTVRDGQECRACSFNLGNGELFLVSSASDPHVSTIFGYEILTQDGQGRFRQYCRGFLGNPEDVWKMMAARVNRKAANDENIPEVSCDTAELARNPVDFITTFAVAQCG